MKLIYRGITYNYTPDHAQAESLAQKPEPVAKPVYHLRYRGSNYDLDTDRVAKPSVIHAIAGLMYRGAVYSLGS